MKETTIRPTGKERIWGAEDLIVSKTNPKGIVTYANLTFLDVSGYTEEEILGQPHSLIRHPDMPRCVFKLLWETIASGREIFAYVKNMTKKGDHYWVFAHVTATFDAGGRIIGYHSNRRCPERRQVAVFDEVYRELLAEERRHANWRDGMAAAGEMLMRSALRNNASYDEFIFSV